MSEITGYITLFILLVLNIYVFVEMKLKKRSKSMNFVNLLFLGLANACSCNLFGEIFGFYPKKEFFIYFAFVLTIVFFVSMFEMVRIVFLGYRKANKGQKQISQKKYYELLVISKTRMFLYSVLYITSLVSAIYLFY